MADPDKAADSPIDAGRWRCEECGWIGRDAEFLRAPNPFNHSDELLGCPRCKTPNKFEQVCDEPGCESEATCGWPCDVHRYRRTCGHHYNARPELY